MVFPDFPKGKVGENGQYWEPESPKRELNQVTRFSPHAIEHYITDILPF